MRLFGGFSFPVGKGRAGVSRRGVPWIGVRGGKDPLYAGALQSVRLPRIPLPPLDEATARVSGVTDIRRHGDVFIFVMGNGDEMEIMLNEEGRKRLEALL